MIATEDLETWVDRLGGGVREVDHPADDLWVVHSGGTDTVVSLRPPVVVLRIRVMETPADAARRQELFRRLLELNATDLVQGAYGLENGHVVLTDTLSLDGLEFRAFEASFDAMHVAIATHSGALAPFREK